MAWNRNITTSIYGRRLGLQTISSGQSGGSDGAVDYLVGPEAFRGDVNTAETTATNVSAFHVSLLPGTSAASSAVYTLDPPVPGVPKWIQGGVSNGPVYLKTANSETFISTVGSSFTTVKISSLGGGFYLVGMTTATWLMVGVTSGTSSQASGFSLSTTT